MKINVLLVNGSMPGWTFQLAETVRKFGTFIIMIDHQNHPASEDFAKMADLKRSWPLHNNEITLAIKEALKLLKLRKKKK